MFLLSLQGKVQERIKRSHARKILHQELIVSVQTYTETCICTLYLNKTIQSRKIPYVILYSILIKKKFFQIKLLQKELMGTKRRVLQMEIMVGCR